MARSTFDPDRLAELEAERSFLLKSLRDLEAEHAAGDVDEHDYTTLRDGYTKRAADVLRQVDAGKAKAPSKRPTNWNRRLAGIGVCVAAAAGIGWVVADSSGQRLPGEEMTGRPVEQRDDADVLLSEARSLFSVGAFEDALTRYQRVLELEPDQVEATTYLGWLLVKGAEGSADEAKWEEAVAGGELLFARAIAADATYADPHCFLAATVADEAQARDEAEQCLALDPPTQLRTLADGVIARLDTPPASDPAPGSSSQP